MSPSNSLVAAHHKYFSLFVAIYCTKLFYSDLNWTYPSIAAFCLSLFLLYRVRPRNIKNAAKYKVVVVGAGFSGICAGVKLKEAGFDFVILEKAHDLV